MGTISNQNNLNLDSLLDELKTPKQEFEQPEPEPEATEDPAIAKVEEVKNKAYSLVGRMIFTIIDVPLTTVAAIIAEESIGKLKLDKESKEYLIEAYTEVARAMQWESVPPWLVLVAVGGASYGSLFYSAFEMRKQKKKAQQEPERPQNLGKPNLTVVKNKTNEASKKSKTDNNLGDKRNGQKHTGGKTVESSKQGTDSNT